MDEQRKPGELGFNIILLAVCVFFMAESMKLYIAASSVSSYGTLPLLLSVFMIAMLLKIIFDTWRKKKPKSDGSMLHRIRGISYAFSKEVTVFCLLIIMYCAALYFGLGFMPCSVVFLFVSMQYFIPGETRTNVIYTAVIAVAVYVIFKMIFKVSLP